MTISLLVDGKIVHIFDYDQTGFFKGVSIDEIRSAFKHRNLNGDRMRQSFW